MATPAGTTRIGTSGSTYRKKTVRPLPIAAFIIALTSFRRDVLRLVTSKARPDDEAEHKISAVQERLIREYGYDEHSAKEALNYVTTLLSQE